MSFFVEAPESSDVVDISAGAATPPADKRVSGIYVGTGGNVTARLVHDTTARTWYNLANGTYLWGQFVSISPAADGTTASNMIWCYACGVEATGA